MSPFDISLYPGKKTFSMLTYNILKASFKLVNCCLLTIIFQHQVIKKFWIPDLLIISRLRRNELVAKYLYF